ncbi:ArsR/SmtB family transcription factor [Streptosporangium sp. OZ121]|uniref:ArsR/SmtB family transcription factor n=1 Tax=Streptosporangium sp. OZ121 TaxID=3444183 RepID=UPI003F7A0377
MKAFVHPAREDLRLDAVLEALAHPLRLRIVGRLADGEELTCSTTLPDVNASTASRHWRVLREGGILWARREGRIITHTLRREDLDARFPGLIDTVIAAVDDGETGEPLSDGAAAG